MLITAEMMSPVVRGKKKLMPSRSTRMSPGRLPNPILTSHGQAKPRTTKIRPSKISNRAMMINSAQPNNDSIKAGQPARTAGS
jgi:hypothetical protein